MRAFFDALILMASPVAGLRPMRAGRSTLANLANPVMATGSPFATTAVTTSVKPRRMASTCLGSLPVWAATACTSSRRFTLSFLQQLTRAHLDFGHFALGHMRPAALGAAAPVWGPWEAHTRMLPRPAALGRVAGRWRLTP